MHTEKGLLKYNILKRKKYIISYKLLIKNSSMKNFVVHFFNSIAKSFFLISYLDKASHMIIKII